MGTAAQNSCRLRRTDLVFICTIDHRAFTPTPRFEHYSYRGSRSPSQKRRHGGTRFLHPRHSRVPTPIDLILGTPGWIEGRP